MNAVAEGLLTARVPLLEATTVEEGRTMERRWRRAQGPELLLPESTKDEKLRNATGRPEDVCCNPQASEKVS